MELFLCHSPLPLPLPLALAGNLPAAPPCSRSVFYGVLGCPPPPPQFWSPPTGLGILGPPPPQPPPTCSESRSTVRFLFRSPAVSRPRRPASSSPRLAAVESSTASSARLLLRSRTSSGRPPPASASSARLLRSRPRRPPRRRRSSEPAAAGFRARRLLAPAPDGWVKLNTDGSFVGRGSSGGAGFVARDSEGLFVFAGASSCPGVNPLYSELWAIRAALTRAIEAGFPRVLLESDSSSAVDLLGGRIKNAPRGRNSSCRTASPSAAASARSSSSTPTGRATGWPTASPPWAADRDRIASTCISTICPTPSPETASCSIFAAAPPCARASFTTSVV
uniref:RNase H type-1 domain-containing protein n=1 Tax=Ananas comosus var. bracteatus TaxID=296719 RepID=A0A6V7NHM3_ANACO|nr:unnamed protein product [Ananas comosus var. bracteatus]